MINQKWCHSQTGRIADSKVAFDIIIQLYCSFRRALGGDIVSMLEAKVTQHKTGKHFCGEGTGKVTVFGANFFPVGHAQFATAIGRGGAIQIADFGNHIHIWLSALGQFINHIVKSTAAAVAPG